MPLRDYQEASVNAAMQAFQEKKSRFYQVGPTGCGKSWIIAELAKRLDGRVLVLQPNLVILYQNYEKYISHGFEAGIFSASAGIKEVMDVTFAMPKSLTRNLHILKKFDYVISDECHADHINNLRKKSRPSTTQRLLGAFAGQWMGLTATPTRNYAHKDHRPTSKGKYDKGTTPKMLHRTRPAFYTKLNHVIQIDEVKKWWADIIYERTNVLKGIKIKHNTSGADFQTQHLQQTLDQVRIEYELISKIQDLRNRGCQSILVFVDSVKRAAAIGTKVPGAEWVADELHGKEIRETVRRFRTGETPILVNVNMLREGADFPSIDAIVIGAPVMSFNAHYQIIGRGVRPHPENKPLIVTDLVGNLERFGAIEDIRIFKHPELGDIVAAGKRLISGCFVHEEHSWELQNHHVVNIGAMSTRLIRDLKEKELVQMNSIYAGHRRLPYINQYWQYLKMNGTYPDTHDLMKRTLI